MREKGAGNIKQVGDWYEMEPERFISTTDPRYLVGRWCKYRHECPFAWGVYRRRRWLKPRLVGYELYPTSGDAMNAASQYLKGTNA